MDGGLYGGVDGVPMVTLFAGLGLSPQQDRNTVYYYGQAGVNVVGLLPFRPKDVLGLAASYTRFSADFVHANRVAGTPVTSQEAIVELTYQASAKTTQPLSMLQPKPWFPPSLRLLPVAWSDRVPRPAALVVKGHPVRLAPNAVRES